MPNLYNFMLILFIMFSSASIVESAEKAKGRIHVGKTRGGGAV
jgi:hypothetical protein